MTELKIGRNDPCPCKSGKKFKKCHGSMTEKIDNTDPAIAVQSIIERGLKAGHIKQCIHPDQSKCSGNIIKAHSIQNNRILNKIGRNGEVYMVKSVMTRHSFRMRFKLIGRKVATTFTGFCGLHDKILLSQSKIMTIQVVNNKTSYLHIAFFHLNITKRWKLRILLKRGWQINRAW